ncbi:MAG: iron-sulfur cluster assembly protein [Planctomycetota bacterium]
MPNKKSNEVFGAAKLVDKSKLSHPEPDPNDLDLDESLMKRGTAGQATEAEPKVEPVKDVPPDLAKLPTGDDGQPRDLNMAELKQCKVAVRDSLESIYDPEIPVNIYDLGMIYNVSVGMRGEVEVKMTLTSPACPVAETLPGEVEAKVRESIFVSQAKVSLVWDPPWTKAMMSEAAKLELNLL